MLITACVQSLVHAGADVRARSTDGDMCVHIAARHGYADIITLLANNGAYSDERGQGMYYIVICEIVGNKNCAHSPHY